MDIASKLNSLTMLGFYGSTVFKSLYSGIDLFKFNCCITITSIIIINGSFIVKIPYADSSFITPSIIDSSIYGSSTLIVKGIDNDGSCIAIIHLHPYLALNGSFIDEFLKSTSLIT